MQWQEIRNLYPGQWLLAEATAAHSEQGRRVVEQLAVVGMFPDSASALRSYAQLHHEAPERELYVLHTSRETLDIQERHWLGVRAAA